MVTVEDGGRDWKGSSQGPGVFCSLVWGLVTLARCLCENVLSCHLHVHFSVRMLRFSGKFPPKSICGLLEAVSG